jgi:cation:H+ antiporter
MVEQSLLLLLSIFVLYWGAEFTLSSAEVVGLKFKLSPLAVGLLIVGFGTSLPEFFVSQLACYRGHYLLSLGNVIGSNVANLFLVLGIAGVLAPLSLVGKELRKQIVIHFILTILLYGILVRGKFDLISSLLFGIFFVIYLFIIYRDLLNSREKSDEPVSEGDQLSFKVVAKLIVGFFLLYVGGELIVKSGSELGKLLGLSEFVISAVFVAFGTSFPEFVTALLACIKKKDTDIIVGNILGSNIFNIAFVLGSVGIYNFEIAENYNTEIITLVFASTFLFGLNYFSKRFHRLGGGIFLLIYAGLLAIWI